MRGGGASRSVRRRVRNLVSESARVGAAKRWPRVGLSRGGVAARGAPPPGPHSWATSGARDGSDTRAPRRGRRRHKRPRRSAPPGTSPPWWWCTPSSRLRLRPPKTNKTNESQRKATERRPNYIRYYIIIRTHVLTDSTSQQHCFTTSHTCR